MARPAKRPDVLCLGTTAVDVMAKPVDRMPEAGTQVLFDGLSIHPGGGALNQAIGLARLGVKVGLAAKVGRDLFGDFLLDTLKTEGVGTSFVIRAKGEPTCFTFAPVESDGTRRYFSCLGTNATMTSSQYRVASSVRPRILAVGGAGVMPRLDGKPLARILKAARARGAITTVDTAYNSNLRDWKPVIKPLLPHADFFFPSIEEARLITGEKKPESVAARLRQWGATEVGIKMGAQGVCFTSRAGRPGASNGESPNLFLRPLSLPRQSTKNSAASRRRPQAGPKRPRMIPLTLPSPKGRGRYLWVPAFRVKVLDASGAGDAFMAGFILGLLDGRPVEECLLRGNAVAAHCIQSVGCTAGLPNRAVLMSFLKTISLLC